MVFLLIVNSETGKNFETVDSTDLVFVTLIVPQIRLAPSTSTLVTAGDVSQLSSRPLLLHVSMGRIPARFLCPWRMLLSL